jgi:TetR/AcrR family transcriptional regulator
MGRSAETNQRMRDERRENILSIALQLFAARGLAATKIGDIARRARMSQGLLYHYFRSKEAIYLELIRRAFERMNTAARGLEQLPVSPRKKIARALEALLQGLVQHEDTALTHLLIAQASASEATPRPVRALIDEERNVPYDVMARIFRAGQKDRSVRAGDPAELALLFWVIVRGLAIHKAAWGDAFRAPAAATLSRVFLVGE